MARSFNSSEYFLGAAKTPILPCDESLHQTRGDAEIKRRARVVGIFPNEASVIRLVGMILSDTNDEWTTDERRYLSEGSMALLYPNRDNEPIAAITDGEV